MLVQSERMRRTPPVIAAMMLALVARYAASASVPASALESRLQAVYDAQCDGLMRKDFTAILRSMSPNFSATVSGQTVTRDDVVSRLRALTAQVRLKSCTSQIESVQESGSVAVAVVRQVLTGVSRLQRVQIDAGRRDVWADVGQDLEQTSSSTMWQDVYVNGRLKRQSGTPPSASPSPRGADREPNTR